MTPDEMKALIAEARLASCSECSEEGTSAAMRCDGDLIRRLAEALEERSTRQDHTELEWEYRRVDPRGVARPATFDSLPALDEGWTAERRALGPWFPVPEWSERPDD